MCCLIHKEQMCYKHLGQMLKIEISKKANYNYVTKLTFNCPGFIFTVEMFVSCIGKRFIRFSSLFCSHAMIVEML